MVAQATLKQVLARLNKAVDALENAAGQHVAKSGEFASAEEEIQRMNADRARIAGELDTSEARAERLADANKEVSRRLVTAMETIRAVLDR